MIKRTPESITAEIQALHELLERFRTGGGITHNDILTAFKLIQFEASLHKRGENYGIIDLLSRCAIEIMRNGRVKLDKGSLEYIRQKMPIEGFVARRIDALQVELLEARLRQQEDKEVPAGG